MLLDRGHQRSGTGVIGVEIGDQRCKKNTEVCEDPSGGKGAELRGTASRISRGLWRQVIDAFSSGQDPRLVNVTCISMECYAEDILLFSTWDGGGGCKR